MNSAITVRLDDALQNRLDALSERLGVSRSDIIREAIRRQLALMAFENHRDRAMPFAEARGFLTDEDVFRDVS